MIEETTINVSFVCECGQELKDLELIEWYDTNPRDKMITCAHYGFNPTHCPHCGRKITQLRLSKDVSDLLQFAFDIKK